ncbi:MAG TPA: hypothetical protein VHB79_03725 [Polyangiaceae bacterium]|nr:hypothetical protein [Polyangiaceae bacterium]
MSLSLVEQRPSGSVSDWATAAIRSESVLLAIVLDTKGSGWRLVVVDAARRRAIARELPGGSEHDAASSEAVASIVISAASALREGLEVASAPVAAVVGDAPSRPADETVVKTGEPLLNGAERSIVVHGSLGWRIASLASAAPTTQGATMALGLAWRNRVEAHAFGSIFWPASIHSAYGGFRVNRALAGIASGPVFGAGGFSVSPEGGVLVERLRRSGTLPAQGVTANEAEPLYRFGGLVEVRLRRALVPLLSVELVAGGSYFGRSVQFSVRNGERSPFLEIGPVVGFVQLGIDIATQ